MKMILNNHVNLLIKRKKFKKFWRRDRGKRLRSLLRNKNHHIIFYNQHYLIKKIKKRVNF